MTLVLRTERLAISPLGESDLDAFVAYRRHPDVARYQSWSPEYSLTDARALLAAQPSTTLPAPGDWLQLALHRREQPSEARLVGDIAIGRDAAQPDTYELGVTLAPAHHGRGYAQEALTAALDALLGSHGAHRVVMQADARNESVLRLMGRLGLRHEGAAVEGDWFKGEWTTLMRFALLAREWRDRPSPTRPS